LKNIIKFIASVNLVLTVLLFLPVFAGIFYNEDIKLLILYNVSGFLISGLICVLLIKHKLKFTIKEAIISVNLVWILIGLYVGYIYYLYTPITLSDGFFEAISGFTTTGATIYSDIEDLPKFILFLRSLTHWLGGMGIVVLSIGLLSLINPTGSITLFKSESTGVSLEKLTPKIKDMAINLWKIYLLLTFLNAILLYFGGMNPFDAINHAFSTISTGGFSTKNSSLGFWENNYFILWVTTFFMLISAITFVAHIKLLQKDFSGYKSQEVKYFLYTVLLLGSFLTLIHIYEAKDSFFHSLTHSFFTIASIITTTGFASTNYGTWSSAAIALIFIPMFIGGNSSSTAGGIKTIRYIILFKNLIAQIKQTLHPNILVGIYVDNKKISAKVFSGVSGFFLLYILTNFILSFFLFAKGYDFLTSFSAAIAVIGNIGPGFGHVGPAENFSIFSDFEKIVLSIFMIIGRLEFYTFIVLFTKSFWRRF